MLLSCAPVVVPSSSLSLFATGAPLAATATTTAIKRGSEELLTHGTGAAVSNGNAISTHPGLVDNNNDAKKAKLDKSAGRPSKVIHLRNIPSEVSEAEIIHLGIPFGRVTNVLVLKGKNQAFLEMADESAATSMVNYFTTCTAQLRGRAVYVQFSNHKELKTDQTHSNSNASAQAALQAAQALSGNSDTQGGPNTVLRVIIEHMLYPITLDVLHQIFSRYGNVLKIVTFTKNNTFQVLIQYPDVVSAQSAKLSLDGQNIYNSCCTLRIEFSKLTSLNVKYNNDKSRDYTNPTLPNGDTTAALDALALPDQLLPQLFLAGAATANPAALQAAARRSLAQNDRLGGGCSNLPSLFSSLSSISSQINSNPFPGSPTGGLPLGNFPLTNTTSNLRIPGQIGGTSCVLLVSNLNEEMVSPDALFTLFGVYGDVLRVKILYNKKDCALIQMAEPQQAQLAMLHMDKLRLFGKEIRVMQSKYQTVQLPKEGQPDAGLTKDYTLSPLHRFKKPGSKNYSNIYSPSATLHLSNIPQNVSEEEIKNAFIKNGFEVREFRFFPKDRRMALIQLNSIDDAVAALIKMHDYQLGETSNLRVSFSKTNIHPENKIQ